MTGALPGRARGSRRLRLGLLVLLLQPAACQRSVLRNCVSEESPALNVTIVDAASGAYLAAGATAVAVDGSFHATLVPGDFAPDGTLATRQGAFGRAGRYEVTVTHSGYRAWQASATATEGVCGVETVALRAELHPAG